MSKKFTKEDRERALEHLKTFRGRELLGIVNSVSRSGMSRRIEFYVATDNHTIHRIGWYMSQIAGFSYDVDKGGILAQGCGMDMIFDCIYNFNMAAKVMENPGASHDELWGNHHENTEYFFPSRYTT